MTFHAPGQPAVELTDLTLCPELTRKAVWIDVFEPSKEEELALEAALGVGVPTREEMQEIELSSRLYKEGDTLFMTAIVLLKADTSHPESSAVTFILTPRQLVTVRYAALTPFQTFKAEREKNSHDYKTAYDVLAGLINAVIERIADVLENVGATLDSLSLEIFDAEGGNGERPPGEAARKRRKRKSQRDYKNILKRIGRLSDVVSRARESNVSFGRLVSFFREMHKENVQALEALSHLETVAGDLGSLSDHATFLSGKVSFLLDATLGMINNEQNAIIKIVSVAAVVFLPPTLVASIYGMNFDVMPELKWVLGYPFAMVLMIASAILPYVYFKRKGWL